MGGWAQREAGDEVIGIIVSEEGIKYAVGTFRAFFRVHIPQLLYNAMASSR